MSQGRVRPEEYSSLFPSQRILVGTLWILPLRVRQCQAFPPTHQICFSVTFLNFPQIKFKLKNTIEEIHCNITPESRTTTTNIKIVQRSIWRWAWNRTLRFFLFLWVYSSNICANEIWVCMSWFSWSRYFINLFFKWGRYTQINKQMYFANYYSFRFFRNHWVTSIEYT